MRRKFWSYRPPPIEDPGRVLLICLAAAAALLTVLTVVETGALLR